MEDKSITDLIKSLEQIKEQQAKGRTTIISVYSFASLILLTLNGLHAIDIPWIYCLLPVGLEIALVGLAALLLTVSVGIMLAAAKSMSKLQ